MSEPNGNVMTSEERDGINKEIINNILLFISTGDERYHGTAVKLIKKRDGLKGSAGNKVFWLIKNSLVKKMEENHSPFSIGGDNE